MISNQMPLWVMFIVFGCVGITAEIFFTSATDTCAKFLANETYDLKLAGKSYAWMFLIYGSAALLFNTFFGLIENWNIFLRMLLIVLTIYLVEYISGFILETTTGTCPWKYYEGIHINGYIRLDYFPFWLIFAFVIEKLYLICLSVTFVR